MALAVCSLSSCKDETPGDSKSASKRSAHQEEREGVTKTRHTRRRTEMRHRLSAYSQQSIDPADAARASKRLGAASEAHKQRVAQMMEKYRVAGRSKEAALEILAESAGLDSTALLELSGELLSHADPEVRGRALAALEGYGNTEMLPLLGRAIQDTDLDVRLQSAQNLGTVVSPEAAPVIHQAFTDADPNVRQMAIQAALNQEPSVRNKLLAEALSAPHADLGLTAILAAQGIHDADMVPLWIQALGHQDGNVRNQAFEAFYLTFRQEPSSASAASAWWNQNRGNYDQNLVLKDEAARRLMGR